MRTLGKTLQGGESLSAVSLLDTDVDVVLLLNLWLLFGLYALFLVCGVKSVFTRVRERIYSGVGM